MVECDRIPPSLDGSYEMRFHAIFILELDVLRVNDRLPAIKIMGGERLLNKSVMYAKKCGLPRKQAAKQHLQVQREFERKNSKQRRESSNLIFDRCAMRMFGIGRYATRSRCRLKLGA